jgi:hypothetical protein
MHACIDIALEKHKEKKIKIQVSFLDEILNQI